jgi:hypothetical protein
MNTLHLTLKKKWFDMIASGEKTEEYREIKPYWAARLVDELDSYPNNDESWSYLGFEVGMLKARHFDRVVFRNGYSSRAPKATFKVNDIFISPGKHDWGAEPGKKYFVIKLGDRMF